jgi:hypothetical protein
VVVYVGGSSQLPSNILGEGGPGSASVNGSAAWVDTVLNRGQGITHNDQPNLGDRAVDFGPWGGSISFNSTSTWNLNPNAIPTSGQTDLFSVALHEMGHVLGVGTSDSWDNKISGSDFTGAASVAEHGGPVPLYPDDAHWADGTLSHEYFNGPVQEASLTPFLADGTRKVFTDLDVAGLADIGWEIKPVPEPSVLVALVGMGLLGAAVYVRRKK